MKSDFHNTNGDTTYKFPAVWYQSDEVCRPKPRIVEGVHPERQNKTQSIFRERQGIRVSKNFQSVACKI